MGDNTTQSRIGEATQRVLVPSSVGLLHLMLPPEVPPGRLSLIDPAGHEVGSLEIIRAAPPSGVRPACPRCGASPLVTVEVHGESHCQACHQVVGRCCEGKEGA